jgi:chorismate dehydratase
MIRLGTVPYCNAFPLTHFLSGVLPNADLTPWYPSEMRQELVAGKLDFALMPVAELMYIPKAQIISNCAIACSGEVRSVRLISKKPIEQIKTIALDTASRSSITICRIILRHFYGINPVQEKLPLDVPLDNCSTDAFAVIGDRALSYQPAEHWQYRYDIGTLWKEKTGLPLVFAAWIGIASPQNNAETAPALETARDKGLAQLAAVITQKQRAGVVFPVPFDEVLDYYRNAIVYQLGEAEYTSLQLFFELALCCGLSGPNEKPLVKSN